MHWTRILVLRWSWPAWNRACQVIGFSIVVNIIFDQNVSHHCTMYIYVHVQCTTGKHKMLSKLATQNLFLVFFAHFELWARALWANVSLAFLARFELWAKALWANLSLAFLARFELWARAPPHLSLARRLTSSLLSSQRRCNVASLYAALQCILIWKRSDNNEPQLKWVCMWLQKIYIFSTEHSALFNQLKWNIKHLNFKHFQSVEHLNIKHLNVFNQLNI